MFVSKEIVVVSSSVVVFAIVVDSTTVEVGFKMGGRPNFNDSSDFSGSSDSSGASGFSDVSVGNNSSGAAKPGKVHPLVDSLTVVSS